MAAQCHRLSCHSILAALARRPLYREAAKGTDMLQKDLNSRGFNLPTALVSVLQLMALTCPALPSSSQFKWPKPGARESCSHSRRGYPGHRTCIGGSKALKLAVRDTVLLGVTPGTAAQTHGRQSGA